LLAAGNALQDLAEVEYADILTLNEPPPSHDPAPPTASFVACPGACPLACSVYCCQRYRGSDPYVCNWLFSGGPAPPAPGPFACGPDPLGSPENLGCGSYPSCS
jgi:hypothetical protein